MSFIDIIGVLGFAITAYFSFINFYIAYKQTILAVYIHEITLKPLDPKYEHTKNKYQHDIKRASFFAAISITLFLFLGYRLYIKVVQGSTPPAASVPTLSPKPIPPAPPPPVSPKPAAQTIRVKPTPQPTISSTPAIGSPGNEPNASPTATQQIPAPTVPPAPPVKHPDLAPTDPASKKSSALSVVTPPLKLKAPITIAVRAPNYADSQYLNEVNAADDLYSSLKSENFKVVDDVNQSIDESKINLFIDVNSVHFSPDTSNESCPNGIAPWDENATIEISVSWNGGDGSSFPISISGNDLRCSDDDAKASALIDAIRNGDNQIRGAIEQAIKDNDSPD